MKLVEGKIILEKSIGLLAGAVVNVFLLDVSLIDAPSKIVVRETFCGDNYHTETKDGLTFTLYGEKPEKARQYSIRVHISLHGSDEVKSGDYITTESNPVLFTEYPTSTTVTVREVE